MIDLIYWIGSIIGLLFGLIILYMAFHIIYDFYKDHIKPRKILKVIPKPRVIRRKPMKVSNIERELNKMMGRMAYGHG